ncbi:hypothetical protein H0H92_005313 [Tricholoma furcatifolium]|nr:hypothetical protein H0H92_005313 [Tricholoma furcatifolium]
MPRPVIPVIPRQTPTSPPRAPVIPMTPVIMNRPVIPQNPGDVPTQALSPRSRSGRRPSTQPLPAERQGNQGGNVEHGMSPRSLERGSTGRRTPRGQNLTGGAGQNQPGPRENHSPRAHREQPQPLPTNVHRSPPIQERPEQQGVEPTTSNQHETSSLENEDHSSAEDDGESHNTHGVRGLHERSRIARQQTPFRRPRSLDEESIGSSNSPEYPSGILERPHRSNVAQAPLIQIPPQSHSPRQPRSPSSNSTTTDSRTTPSTSPTTPASQSQPGPSRGHRQPRHNPLPSPPVDIFSLPQYAKYLKPAPEPEISGVPNGQGFIVSTVDVSPSPVQNQEEDKRKKKKSIFRTLSLRRKSAAPQSPPPASTPTQYVVVSKAPSPKNTNPPPGVWPTMAAMPQSHQAESVRTDASASHPQDRPWPTDDVVSQLFTDSRPSTLRNQPTAGPVADLAATAASPVQSSHTQNHDAPQPEQNTRPRCIEFDQDSEYSYFLMHSRHRVFYEKEIYPTAAHLLEALKFLPDRPEIAEQIRKCKEPQDALRISALNAQFADPTFAISLVEKAYMVANLKFRQNANLRYTLNCMNYETKFIYNDPSDSFWGIGYDGRGKNELGKIMERVLREVKLRRRAKDMNS